MNYELAKELKYAGYRQPVIEGNSLLYPGRNMAHGYIDTPDGGESVYCPTLEELIEACGEGFYKLLNHQGTYHAKQREEDFAYGTGSTPSEAVALLYISLNKHE